MFPMKVYNEDLCNQLQNCKDQLNLTILDMYRNEDTGAVNLGGRLKG